MSTGYTCHCCNQHHDEIAMSYGTDIPVYIAAMKPRELKKRVMGNSFMCIIDQEHCFVRGNIMIPIIGTDENFAWGVWSSMSIRNFEIAIDNLEVEGREEIVKPAFGYLSVPLPVYPSTMNLKLLIHTMPVGILPIFELEPTNHPLAIEQRKGITMERVHEINRIMSQ